MTDLITQIWEVGTWKSDCNLGFSCNPVTAQFLAQNLVNIPVALDALRHLRVRSPDMTSPDFYLWGYLKDVVYEHETTTREDMIHRIQTACENIPRAVLLRTVEHFQQRIELCIQ
ncbi:hypothetical protein TSAR_007422 [Trichomalopsis sarcophagae]|uniref:Uncharacterized protein n=1 Tax=Trichomalopsis sarcophagae TaxID=543379 RepID=A0A232EDH3_9HYME|nr:hypothetical protein TSAR_007422 [Trichomalopsis sarcophagae]